MLSFCLGSFYFIIALFVLSFESLLFLNASQVTVSLVSDQRMMPSLIPKSLCLSASLWYLDIDVDNCIATWSEETTLHFLKSKTFCTYSITWYFIINMSPPICNITETCKAATWLWQWATSNCASNCAMGTSWKYYSSFIFNSFLGFSFSKFKL